MHSRPPGEWHLVHLAGFIIATTTCPDCQEQLSVQLTQADAWNWMCGGLTGDPGKDVALATGRHVNCPGLQPS